MAAVPPLATTSLGPSRRDPNRPPTPHANTGRRLSKSIMRADSQDEEASKGWGMLTMRDHTGEHKPVRVVQKSEFEDSNMVKITWFWSWENQTHQVELRHGRRSGIRKIYVDKMLLERQRSIKNMLSDTGSTHEFVVGGKRGEVMIVPKGASGFLYQLKIDGQAIEQNMVGPVAERPLDIGTRPIQLPKTVDGLGMTLRNNPFKTGVVVWTVEENKAASNAGLRIGDVVLSIEDHLIDSIDNLVEYVGEAEEFVNMEVAGIGQSKQVSVVKARDKPVGLGLQVTSCGVGILVTEVDAGGSAAQSAIKVGDTLLSINGVVPTSPKHAVQLITSAEYIINLIVIGHEPDGTV